MTALDALHRAYEAWRLTEPQLFWTDEVLWPDGLDEPQTSALRFVEPAASTQPLPSGGLTAGAEPCHPRGGELTAGIPSPPDPISSSVALAALSAGSAPLTNSTGPDAPPAKGARPAQEVTV